MLVTNKRSRFGVKMETVYFAEKPNDYHTSCDAVLYYSSPEYPKGDYYGETSYTILLDLTRDEEALLNGMNRTNRRLIKAAMAQQSIITEFNHQPTQEDIEVFCESYNRFARAKGIQDADMAHLNRLRDMGRLHLIYSRLEDKEILGAMSFVLLENRAYFVYACSNYLLTDNKDKQKLCSLANRKMYWLILMYLKEQGCQRADFGGYANGTKDHALDGLDQFKSSFGGDVIRECNFYRGYSWKGKLFVGFLKLIKKPFCLWD